MRTNLWTSGVNIMYQIIKGIPLKDIQFNIIKATSGKYRNKMICDDVFAFDTETTSDFIDENGNPFLFDYDNPKKAQDSLKHSVVYLWQFGINDNIYIGRDIDDLTYFLYELKQYCPFLKICFVHNLAFDFNFLQNVLKFDKVFARKPRHPMTATCNYYGIEFRCSYVLMSISLETWATSLNLPVKKQTGLLEYHALRTPFTPLTDNEILYAISDIGVIYHGINKLKTQYGHIANIPLTHTGKTRLQCTEIMQSEYFYNNKITKLMPQTLDEYIAQAHAFIGGTVLCNWLYKDRVIKDVMCYDIASSYPWVLINNLYPMSPFYNAPKGKENKYMYNDKYLYLVHFTATNIDSNFNCHFLSRSKAIKLKNVVTDNGRIISCDSIELILTSVDYEIFLKAYRYNELTIHEFKFCRAGYLNDKFRKFVIELYKNKTKLKGIKDPVSQELYQNSKASINSLYGDFVTKIFSDEIVYKQSITQDNWTVEELTDDTFNKKLSSLNKKSSKNYKAFIQGVFVTAWARKRIWDAVISGLDENIVYTDTDSLKVSDYDGDYFEIQNNVVLTRHVEIAKQLNIDVSELSPLDIKGKPHPIGIWEFEEKVNFKSLGCKQYITENDAGELHLTCAGISKLAVQCFKTIDDFERNTQLTEKQLKSCNDGKGHTAEKLTPYYDNNYPVVTYPDGYICKHKYGVCLMPTTFNLSITPNDLYHLFTIVNDKLNKSYYKKGNIKL